MEKNKGHFSAYPGRLAPPEARPAHIACRSQERSSQSGTHPRPSLKTLRQIQTFAVCKCKKPNYRKISKKSHTQIIEQARMQDRTEVTLTSARFTKGTLMHWQTNRPISFIFQLPPLETTGAEPHLAKLL